MGRCNPRQVFPINTCSRHGTSNNEEPRATKASILSPPPLLRRQGYFIPFVDVHLRLGEQVSRTVVLSNPTPGRGRIRFLRSELHGCSLASSSSSSRLIYLFVGRAPRVASFNANSVKLIVIIKEPQVTYSFSSQIIFYILDRLIYLDMILLDNLLQCLLFIGMIDLCRTCDSTTTLIYNALIMFMIYP
jgi:hypothetical protein